MLTAVPPVVPHKASTSSFSSRAVRFGRRDDTLVLHSKQSKKPLIDRYSERYADRFLDWFQNWIKNTWKSIKGLMLIPLSFGVAIVAALGVSVLSKAFNAPPKGKRAILPTHLANNPAVAQAAPWDDKDAFKLALQDGQSYDFGNYAGGLHNPWLSERQARITRSGNDYFIEDLNSEHGTYIQEGSRWKQLAPNQQVPITPGTPLMMGREVFVFDVENNNQYFDRIALTQSRKFAETGRIPFDEPILEGFRVAAGSNSSFHSATGVPTQNPNQEVMWVLTRDNEVARAVRHLENEFSRNRNWNDLQKLLAIVRGVKRQVPPTEMNMAMKRHLANQPNKNLSMDNMIIYQRENVRRFRKGLSRQQFQTVSLQRALLAKSVVDKVFADKPDGFEMEVVRYKDGYLNRIRFKNDVSIKKAGSSVPKFFFPAGTELLVDCMSGRICTMDVKEVGSYKGNKKKPVYATESPHPPLLVAVPGGAAVQVITTFNEVVPEP